MISQFAKVSEGSLFENAVFHNIKKYEEVRYYQRRSGGEIDFILTNKLIELEVKQTGVERDYIKLKKYKGIIIIPQFESYKGSDF